MHTLRLLGIRFKTADQTNDCNPGGKTLHIHVIDNKNGKEEKFFPLNEKDEVMKVLCKADQQRLLMLLDGFDENKVNIPQVNFFRWFEKRRERNEERKKQQRDEYNLMLSEYGQ